MKTFKVFMEEQELLETPQYVPATNFEFDKEEVRKKSIPTSYKVVGKFKGFDILETRDREYFVLNKEKTEVIYKMTYSRGHIEWLNKISLTQIEVWSYGGIQGLGIPKYVFWNFLYDYNKCVVTDSHQTPAGSRFWMRRVEEAYLKGLNVYHINLLDKTIVPILKVNDAFNHTIYGDDRIHNHQLLCISKEKLPKE